MPESGRPQPSVVVGTESTVTVENDVFGFRVATRRRALERPGPDQVFRGDPFGGHGRSREQDGGEKGDENSSRHDHESL